MRTAYKIFDRYDNGKLYLNNKAYPFNTILSDIAYHQFHFKLTDLATPILNLNSNLPYVIVSILIPDTSPICSNDFMSEAKQIIIVELLNGLYISDGKKFRFSNGLLHHDNKPAIAYENHVCRHEQWLNHGYRHNLIGPAITDSYSGYNNEFYYIHGRQTTKKELEMYIYYLNLYRMIIQAIKYN